MAPQHKWAKEAQQKHQDWIKDYKTSWGCIDCGWNKHHAGLELDHARGEKTIGFSQARSATMIVEELLKCDVVCGTCHNLRTWRRSQGR